MDEVPAASSSAAVRSTKLTKPAKVSSWSSDITLETYIKQLESQTEINEGFPELVKFHDLVENLKINKEMKG